jgi:hypothetical protein
LAKTSFKTIRNTRNAGATPNEMMSARIDSRRTAVRAHARDPPVQQIEDAREQNKEGSHFDVIKAVAGRLQRNLGQRETRKKVRAGQNIREEMILIRASVCETSWGRAGGWEDLCCMRSIK